jgi:hypothetical protein
VQALPPPHPSSTAPLPLPLRVQLPRLLLQLLQVQSPPLPLPLPLPALPLLPSRRPLPPLVPPPTPQTMVCAGRRALSVGCGAAVVSVVCCVDVAGIESMQLVAGANLADVDAQAAAGGGARVKRGPRSAATAAAPATTVV